MKTTKLNKLKRQYEFVCNEYVTKFCNKQEMNFEGWICNTVGDVAEKSINYYSYTKGLRITDLK